MQPGVLADKRFVLVTEISKTNVMNLSASFLTWLRSFDAAARLGGFTRAAGELHLTQSAVSQQIRLLEQHLGTRLFHRLPGRLELTTRGQRLFSEVSPALQRIRSAVVAMRALEGPLNISCSPSFAHRWLVPRLGSFMRAHPDLEVNLRAEYHTLNRDTFLRDGLHVALRYDCVEYTDLNAQTLMDEFLLPVAAPGNLPDDDLDPATVTLLHDDEPWEGAPTHVEWQSILSALGLRANDFRSRRFNLADLALAAARSGEGAAAARMALVLDDLADGKLQPLSGVPVPAPCRYVMLTLDDEDWRIGAFADWLGVQCADFVKARKRFLRRSSQAMAN